MASVTHQALLMVGTAGAGAVAPKGWAQALSTVPPSALKLRGMPFWADASSYAGAWLHPVPQVFVAPPPFGWAVPFSKVAPPAYNARRADASYANDWLSPQLMDPFWTNVVLLLGFNDVNGSTGAPGFTDESSHAHGTTLGSGVISTAQSVFGGSSARYSGGGVRSTYGDSVDWNLSTRLFTIEYRFRPVSVAFGFHMGQWPSFAGDQGWIINSDTAYKLNVSTTGANNLNDVASAAVFAVDTWYACCVDFDGTKYRAYVNGTMVASSTTLRTIHNSATLFSIGAGATGSFSSNCYFDELRITMDVARYASDGGYTVATVPFPRA